MSLYDGPRDVNGHLAELENRFPLAGYDHRRKNQPEWQAERQLARMRELDRDQHPAESRKVTRFATIIRLILRSGNRAS
ncbi:MAG: hypothetical protein HKO14_11430 [Silicimonas sp.]|nr:hypothetical protein [Silicimonas sp.]